MFLLFLLHHLLNARWYGSLRAGTTMPFNTETSISAEESNYWGSYPYLIEDNYFSQGNLETQPGVYRNTTVEVDSFNPNAWGLYNMHGNVGEWVWDFYGDYDTSAPTDPTGAGERHPAGLPGRRVEQLC